MTNQSVSHFSDALGWMYFLAWSISFYPQIILNYKRRSVVGLSFDYVMYNIQGFLFYSTYSIVNYIEQHRLNLTHSVQPNDIAFGVHAVVMTVIIIVQCLIYERRNQSINRVHMFISGVLWMLAFYNIALGLTGYIPWYNHHSNSESFSVIDFLGYGKTFISFIKYVPQAYLNYKTQATVGWAVGAVLLDFTGGLLSFLQQLIDSINEDDWSNLTGNVPKLILALESMGFDLLFMFQHYVLYRHNRPVGAMAQSGDDGSTNPVLSADRQALNVPYSPVDEGQHILSVQEV